MNDDRSQKHTRTILALMGKMLGGSPQIEQVDPTGVWKWVPPPGLDGLPKGPPIGVEVQICAKAKKGYELLSVSAVAGLLPAPNIQLHPGISGKCLYGSIPLTNPITGSVSMVAQAKVSSNKTKLPEDVWLIAVATIPETFPNNDTEEMVVLELGDTTKASLAAPNARKRTRQRPKKTKGAQK